MGIFIENIGKNEQVSTRKTSKPSHEASNNIKTESYNKETMLINRRAKADVPSAYEISKRNYKQSEITRANEDRSKSKTRDGSGSYKKRFEYQYSRQATREDEEQPQAPPSQRPQLKEERGSPMPRIKTPEPISDSKLSFQSQRPGPKTQRNPPNSNYLSSPDQVSKYQSNIPSSYNHIEHLTRHKIIIDVEHSTLGNSHRHFIEEKSRYEEEIYEEDSNDYGRDEIYDASRFSTFNPHQENSRSNIGKIEHVKKYHEENEKEDEREKEGSREVGVKSKQKKLNQNQGSSGNKQNVNRDNSEKSEEKVNNFSYGGYHHSKSFDEEYPKPSKQTANNPSNYQQQKQNHNTSEENKAISTPSNQNTKKDNNYENKQESETVQASSRNNKTVESIRDKSRSKNENKEQVDQFRDINKKFEFIQNHINSKKSSPNHDKSQNNQTYQKEDASFEENKKHSSPPKMNKNDPKDLKKEHIDSSANTFNENHFESHLESSPDRHNTTDVKHIKSFTFEPEDLNKNSIEERVGAKGKEKKDQQMFESSVQTFEKVNESKGSENFVNNLYEDSKDDRNGDKQLGNKNDEKNVQKKSKPTENKMHQINDQAMHTVKNNTPKINSNSITTSLQLNILPEHPQTLLDPSKDKIEHDLQALKKNYEEKIIALENEVNEKEKSFRKEMMEKDEELRNVLKEEEKSKEIFEERIKGLEEENLFLHNRQKEVEEKYASFKKESKQSSNDQELSELKRENERLKDLNQSLHNQLEESDDKQFEIQTSLEKKNIEFQRKMTKLETELKNKEKELKDYIENNNLSISKPEATSLKNFQAESNGSVPIQNKSTVSQGELKSYEEEYLTEKKKNVNLESQIRQKDNDLRFSQIKIENLLKEKKVLEDEIDNIVSNNKHELARQGSIHRINMESASVSNSVQVENKVLKEQVGNLQKQVQELNSLLEGLITEGSVNEERLSSNKDTATLENYHNLSKKYDAVEKKCEAYEEEVKNSHIKIGQIMNIIFSHNDRELIDEVQKLL